jgi:nitroreductase
METDEAIRKRTSVRSFTNRKVEDALISELLELAAQAPSAGNTQEWVFIVVKDPEKARKVAGTPVGPYSQIALSTASCIIVVCADTKAIEKRFGERGIKVYAFQDTAAAIENLMLAATSRGLSTCWVGAFNEFKVQDILDLPGNIFPVAMVALGYAAEKNPKPARKPLRDFAFRDAYGAPFANK